MRIEDDGADEPRIAPGVRMQINMPTGPTKRQVRAGCGCLSFLVLAVLLGSLVRPYTDYLWFLHDAGQPEVFLRSYSTKGTLFLFAFLAALALLLLSLTRAAKVGMVYLKMPNTVGERMMSNALGFVQEHAGLVTRLAAILTAFVLAMGFSGEWNTYLLSQAGESFGVKDPLFERDLGFFVFQLPWWLAISNFATGLLMLTTILTIGIYVGMQVMASLAKIELSKPFVRFHVSLLIGLTILSYALQFWLRRYEFGFVDGQQFTGAGFAAVCQIAVQGVIAALLAVLGVLTIVSGRIGGYRVPIVGGAAVAVLYVLGMWVYPGIVQRFQVEPNRLETEGPFASRAIKMTRYAYGLDQIQVQDTDVRDEPTAEELSNASATLGNMRLWDPDVLRQSIESLQGLRPYYTFHDVDVDRYELNGKQKMVMLSPRDIEVDGLSDQAKTWINTRLQYTHGFGVVMSPVDSANAQGQPNFLIKDLPPKTPPELTIDQPRIYFSDFRDFQRMPRSEYALVNTGVAEFDFPAAGSDQKYRWTGKRGVPVDGFLARAAYSAILGDGNLLISSNIRSGTRLIYRRNVIDRASLVYPFLHFDADPYIVVFKGRLLWILDGYTHTDRVPYSERVGVGQRLNYIRNSVKVTIDAYTGAMNAYAVQPDEPVLKAYRKIYPRLISEASGIPEGLREHFRYPEDLFGVQSAVLTQYHVTDPVAFLNNEDAWEIPNERGQTGGSEQVRPYYVQIQLPHKGAASSAKVDDEFLLILPFTPRRKQNLAGWLAARCDPANYGELILFRYPKDRVMAGPSQMEARFNQDRFIADINRQFTNDQSEIVPGNLLVVPIGQSILYVKPLFLQSRSSGSQPELKKVILALNSRVVVGDTYQEALDKLFGTSPVKPALPVAEGTTEPTTAPAPGEVSREAVRRALGLLDQAEQALRAGNFARYGELQRQAREALRSLAR